MSQANLANVQQAVEYINAVAGTKLRPSDLISNTVDTIAEICFNCPTPNVFASKQRIAHNLSKNLPDAMFDSVNTSIGISYTWDLDDNKQVVLSYTCTKIKISLIQFLRQRLIY